MIPILGMPLKHGNVFLKLVVRSSCKRHMTLRGSIICTPAGEGDRTWEFRSNETLWPRITLTFREWSTAFFFDVTSGTQALSITLIVPTNGKDGKCPRNASGRSGGIAVRRSRADGGGAEGSVGGQRLDTEREPENKSAGTRRSTAESRPSTEVEKFAELIAKPGGMQ